MRTYLLPFLFVLSAGSAVAAPCDVLPYANQCQGSNLWPVPSGWSADNNGDCQPQPPSPLAESYQYAWGGSGERLPTAQQAIDTHCATPPSVQFGYLRYYLNCHPTGSLPYASGQGQSYYWLQFGYDLSSTNQNPGRWDSGVTTISHYTDSGYMHPVCPTGYTWISKNLAMGTQWTYANSLTCWLNAGASISKPSDGFCSARWTSAAKTALEKDPLDPDCDANSCVLDGVCKLR